ncbi:hypothetical protein C8R43DRAFT_910692, partial [Mycena crocata]
EVGAKYLPALVHLFRSRQELLGSAATLMNMISTTPYFIRFLRTSAGQGLAALQAKRIARAALDINAMDVNDVGEIGQFLTTILLLQGTRDVAAEDRDILLQYLPVWDQKFRGELAAETAKRCLVRRNVRQTMQKVKKELESKIDRCGGPGCLREVRQDGSELFQCGRCMSAVYCGAQHQKAAWVAHKQLCFPTAF